MLRMPALTRSTSTEFAAPTGSAAELWKAIQSEPEYAGKTTLFILPDFGRDSDEDAGGNGFQHHRTGDVLSRTTWMLVAGPGIREGVVYDRAMESTDLGSDLGSDAGIFSILCPGQASQRVAVEPMLPRISNRSISPAIRRRRASSSPTIWECCGNCPSALCRVCCAN